MVKEQNRVVFVDVLKIVSIFAMMVLHLSASKWSAVEITSFQWQVFNLYNSAVRFCVPIFVMVSGSMFLSPRRTVDVKRLFTKNILRIITAFLFWSTAYAVLIPTVIVPQEFSLRDIVYNLVVGHYHLWFLFTLVALYISVPILRKVAEDRALVEYYLVFVFLFCYAVKFVSNFGDTPSTVMSVLTAKASLGMFGGYTGYFLLGHYLMETELSPRCRKIIYGLAVVGYLFTAGAAYFFSLRSGVPVDGWYSYFSPNVWLVSCGVFVFFKYEVSRIQWSPRALAAINLTTKLSFGMYLVHEFFIQIYHQMGYSTLSYSPVLSVPCNGALVFACSFVTSYALSKIPKLNQYIM